MADRRYHPTPDPDEARKSGASERSPMILLGMCLLLFPGFLRFSVLCALFINNSRGYLLFTAGITSFLFEFGLQLLIFMFSFRARSSWHSRSLPFGFRDDWNRVSFEQSPLFFRTTEAGRMCAWEENILLRHRSRDRARLNSARSRFNPGRHFLFQLK